MGVADQERLKGGIAEMSENNNTGEVKESRLKEIINTQLENQQEKKRPEKKPAREISEKLKHLLSKDIALMNVQKKTRGAEIMGIFARHNFYAGGITPEELRSTLEDLGPTYVKIGQIISSRTDLLPESYCAELVTLRQRVQPLDPEVAKAVIEDQTGKKIDEIFSEFKDEPIGSASIAQAHYGVLKDGTKVVTKVQRPLIAEMMYEDFELLKKIGSIVNVVSDGGDGTSLVDLVSVIEEFEAVTREELDFRVEADNTREFREKCIEDETQISCPRIIDELSTDKILTMTYVDGYSISDKERIISEGYDVEDVGARIVNNYVHQVLDSGLFHADPHQGNIMFAGGIPYWIDFGMIGRISESNINMISKIVLGVIQGDAEDIVSAAMSMGTTSEKTDTNKLMKDVDSFMNKFMTGTSIDDVNVDEMFTSFSDLAAANYISLPSEFTMLVRSIIMIEGVIEELCPSLNLFKLLSDKFMERAKQNFDLKQSLIDVGQEVLSMGKKASKIPTLVADALRDIVKGNTKINLELMGYDALMNSLSVMIKNIILAIFSCVIFTGSCVLCLTDIGPATKSGMPLISAVGFLFSIALGIHSVKQMSRKR